MIKSVLTYQLSTLIHKDESEGVFFLNQRIDRPEMFINVPFRRNFYAIGICLQGKAELKANLETYAIKPGCIVAKPPFIINQWTAMSDDYETLTVFFTKEFISCVDNNHMNKFAFFETGAKHVFQAEELQSKNIISSLQFIRGKYDTCDKFRKEILRSSISSMLYEISSIYEHQSISMLHIRNRSQYISSEFKKLVNAHFFTERNLKFYADKLCITRKHLTETVKEATGMTAGEWIEEAVVTEAKVLLQNHSFSIAQVSDMLSFSNQSAFGKFFKNHCGVSPKKYKLYL